MRSWTNVSRSSFNGSCRGPSAIPAGLGFLQVFRKRPDLSRSNALQKVKFCTLRTNICIKMEHISYLPTKFVLIEEYQKCRTQLFVKRWTWKGRVVFGILVAPTIRNPEEWLRLFGLRVCQSMHTGYCNTLVLQFCRV